MEGSKCDEERDPWESWLVGKSRSCDRSRNQLVLPFPLPRVCFLGTSATDFLIESGSEEKNILLLDPDHKTIS